MKKILAALLLVGLSGCSSFSTPRHWTYSGSEGPQHWAELSDNNFACAKGKNQSPLNIVDAVEANLDSVILSYRAPMTRIINNGHTIQVKVGPGSKFVEDKDEFELQHFNFHAPSENLIAGQSFPMEAHFIHADSQGNLAVVAILFTEGDENPAIKKLWSSIPVQAGDEAKISGSAIDYLKLFPFKMDLYRYNGSLTTPPCSEGVRWFVLKQPVTVSMDQIETFIKAIGHDNNRPVQPLYAREILE